MHNIEDCIIIIPVYKPLEKNDIIVIKQAVAMTPGMKKVFIMPDSFTIDKSFAVFSNFSIERFENHFFVGKLGYNRLMLCLDFYKRFSNYKYMLIHQTDAYLFKPDLQYWCNKNYDYIGAPWLRPHKIKKAKIYLQAVDIFPWIFSSRLRNKVRHYNNVGNGGLSLRRIDTFIKILESDEARPILNLYLEKQLSKRALYIEDVFWSIEGPQLYEKFTKPVWREACRFSLENHPSFAYDIMNKQLPFGCHAPLVHDPVFWRDHIPYMKTE